MKTANDYTAELLSKLNNDLSPFNEKQILQMVLGFAMADNNEKVIKELEEKCKPNV